MQSYKKNGREEKKDGKIWEQYIFFVLLQLTKIVISNS